MNNEAQVAKVYIVRKHGVTIAVAASEEVAQDIIEQESAIRPGGYSFQGYPVVPAVGAWTAEN